MTKVFGRGPWVWCNSRSSHHHDLYIDWSNVHADFHIGLYDQTAASSFTAPTRRKKWGKKQIIMTLLSIIEAILELTGSYSAIPSEIQSFRGCLCATVRNLGNGGPSTHVCRWASIYANYAHAFYCGCQSTGLRLLFKTDFASKEEGEDKGKSRGLAVSPIICFSNLLERSFQWRIVHRSTLRSSSLEYSHQQVDDKSSYTYREEPP